MTFEQFTTRLYHAGWRSSCDAQHVHIRELWDELFPTQPPRTSHVLNPKKTGVSIVSVNFRESTVTVLRRGPE